MSQGLKGVEGVVDAEVLFDDKRAEVKYDPDAVTPQKLVEVVNATGFRATVLGDEQAKDGDLSTIR